MFSVVELRRRWKLGLFALVFIMPFVRYRLPNGRPIEVKAEVLYLYVDMGQGDLWRSIFEIPLGNRRLFLVGNRWMFVSNADFKRCWPVPDMRHSDYTLEVTLAASPLLFGGHGIAKVVAIERLDKRPVYDK